MLGWMLKTNLKLFFCSCRSVLMHQHHQLHHTTSSHEQLQGAARVSGCLPSGLPPARPQPRGLLARPGKVTVTWRDSLRSHMDFPRRPEPAAALALPYQPAEAVISARLRSILAKSSICLPSLAGLSKPYRGTAAVPCGFAADAAAARAGGTGTPRGSGAGSPLRTATCRSPLPARGAAANRQRVWKPLAAPRLLLSAPGESLVIPQHASAKDESVFSTLVFGLASNANS